MSTSKLMKVTYYDPKSQIRLLCYADTVVWDTKPTPTLWCPLTGVTLQVSEPPADIASAVSAGDFFLSHAPLAVD